MSRGTGIHAPYHGGLVLEDGFGFERDPVTGEGAVARGELEGDGRGEHFEVLNERAAGLGLEIRQLFFIGYVSNKFFWWVAIVSLFEGLTGLGDMSGKDLPPR